MKTGHWLPLYKALYVASTVVYSIAFRFRTYFRTRMPSTGGVLIVSNHQSFLDPSLVGISMCRPVNFMARESLFTASSWFGKFIASLGAFPLRRGAADMKALRHAVELLKSGHVVLIYPEGTRTPDGRIGQLQDGYVMLARRGRATILPCVIDGANEAWPRTAKFARPGRINIALGEPITPEQMKANGRQWVAKEVDRRMVAMQQHLREMHGQPALDYSKDRWTFEEVQSRFKRDRAGKAGAKEK